MIERVSSLTLMVYFKRPASASGRIHIASLGARLFAPKRTNGIMNIADLVGRNANFSYHDVAGHARMKIHIFYTEIPTRWLENVGG